MLITLVIIGVVAAITVPALLNSVENQEHKVNYKKAYSDLSQAAAEGVAFGEFPYRETKYDVQSTTEEWNILKSKFGVIKVCENHNLYDCWVDADRVCTGAGCGDGNGVPQVASYGFVDLSGRSWALFSRNENVFLVDTNGDKGPNHFGKDRWIFTFADENGKRICSDDNCTVAGFPKKIIPYFSYDVLNEHNWCHHPPCYYKSWLIN